MDIHPLLRSMALVICGGGLGAACRYGIGLLALKWLGGGFAWGTLAVNLSGCFLIGLLFGLAERIRVPGPEMRLLLITGYLGGLTTFSAFSLETVGALRSGMIVPALSNILLNNFGGIAMTLIGMRLAEILSVLKHP